MDEPIENSMAMDLARSAADDPRTGLADAGGILALAFLESASPAKAGSLLQAVALTLAPSRVGREVEQLVAGARLQIDNWLEAQK